MDLHGEMWLYRAMSALNSATDSQADTVDHWTDLIEKMRAIEQSPRQ